MLLWATRRTLCCHGSVAGSAAGRRAGNVASFTADLPGIAAPTPPASGDAGARAFRVEVSGIAAPVVRPVLRNARRLSIGTPYSFSAGEVYPPAATLDQLRRQHYQSANGPG